MVIGKEVFSILEINAKANLIWGHGKYIASRTYYNYSISLYSLSGFFVEVGVFDNSKEIEKIEVFDTSNRLKLYMGRERLN